MTPDDAAVRAAVAAEQARIAGLLHQEAAQALSAALLHLDVVQHAVAGTQAEEPVAALGEAVAATARSLREVLAQLRA